MKILLFTQYYPPDIGAQAFRMEALVKALLKRDHKVSVITAEPHRYNLKEKIQFKKYEKDSKLEIYRIRGGKNNDTFWRRPINYVIFMINSLTCSLKIKNNGESFNLIFTTSPPITSAVTACISAFFRRVDFVLEVRDLWPDTLVDLKIFKNRMIINFLTYVEKILYRKAKLIVVVSENFKEKIITKGVNENKIATFTNGLDKEFILQNIDIKTKNIFREQYKISKEKVVVSYVGNVGISQNLETIIEAAEKIEDNNILFLVVGEGLEKKRLLKLAKERRLDNNILFLDALPRDKIKEIYKLSDILFLQLKDLTIFNRTIPSKIFEYLGSGVPIIYGLNGVTADILKESENGIKIKPECDDDLVEAIKMIKNKYDFYLGRAKRGREFVIKNYTREEIMKNYVSALEERFLSK